MLALHGMDAYGLEVSQTAVDAANEYANIEQTKPRDHNFSSPDPTVTSFLGSVKGTFNFVVGDFFKSHWEDQCKRGGEGTETGFDLIYDYTVSSEASASVSRWRAVRNGVLTNLHSSFCAHYLQTCVDAGLRG